MVDDKKIEPMIEVEANTVLGWRKLLTWRRIPGGTASYISELSSKLGVNGRRNSFDPNCQLHSMCSPCWFYRRAPESLTMFPCRPWLHSWGLCDRQWVTGVGRWVCGSRHMWSRSCEPEPTFSPACGVVSPPTREFDMRHVPCRILMLT